VLKESKNKRHSSTAVESNNQDECAAETDFCLVESPGEEEIRAALLADEASRMSEKAAEARQRAELAGEVAAVKYREAKDARQRATLAEGELLREEKAALDVRKKARLAQDELLRRKKNGAKEIRRNFRKVPWPRIIKPDNSELLYGKFTLAFSPETPFAKIVDLMQSLSAEPKIKNLGTGGIAGKGSWSKISIESPIPLFWILYRLPLVRRVSWKNNAIHLEVRQAFGRSTGLP
jgi:hypothetical protein